MCYYSIYHSTCHCLFKQAASALQRIEVDCANMHETVQRGHVSCLKLLLVEVQATRAPFDEHRETLLRLSDHSLTAVCHELTATLLAAPATQVKAMLNVHDKHGTTYTVLTDSSSKSASTPAAIAAAAALAVCYTCIQTTAYTSAALTLYYICRAAAYL
jgi:acetylglutamate synthase